MLKIQKSPRTLLMLIVLLIVVAGLSAFLYLQSRNGDSLDNDQAASGEVTNLSPPTEQEKKESADNKSRLSKDEDASKPKPNTSSDGKIAVTPIIQFASQNNAKIEVSSYVPGIFEDDGTCTANFSKDGKTVLEAVKAQKEGNATYCPLIVLDSSEFQTKGEWVVSVTYSSLRYSGSSTQKKVDVK